GVRVQVEAAVRAEAGLDGGRRRATRVDDGRVVGPGLAPYVVELDAEHALGLADFTDEVEPAADAGVPEPVFLVEDAGVVVRDVLRIRRDVVDESIDGHLRRRRLR